MVFFRRILLMSPEFLVKYPLLTSDRHRPADVDDGYFLSFLPVFFFFFFFFFLEDKNFSLNMLFIGIGRKLKGFLVL